MPPTETPPTETPPESTVWPYIGVGCLTMVVGFFGGGMIAMLIGRITDLFSGCQSGELPVCDWWKWWWAGSLMGMVALPFFAVRRLRAARRPSSESSDSR